MLLKGVVLFLVTVNALAKEQISEIPNVDHIFDNLSKQHWDADEVQCRDKIFNILENLRNSTLWATWVWNSMEQSPTGTFFGARYHMGNYDQCLRPPWLASHPQLRTQYCLADIEMHKGGVRKMQHHTNADPYAGVETYFNKKTLFGRSFSFMGYGVCLPAGCQSKSAEKLVKAIMSTGYLRAAMDAHVSIHHCEEAGVPHYYPKGFYAYIYTFAALLFVAVASTYYISEYPVTAGSNSVVNHIAKSFCLRRNWNTVFEENENEIKCLHGIRFLTAVIIVIIHYIAFIGGTSVANALDFEMLPTHKPKFAVFMIHFSVLVDTFFAMSGLLLGKTLPTLDVTKPYNLIKNILKRYFRLIGPFAVTVFYAAHVLMHTDDGPLFPKIVSLEQQACEKNWWLALLMLGNYFNTEEMCHPATWYIPCDFHFYVITMLLLYVYRKNQSVGKAATAVVLLVGFLAPAITTYIYDLPAAHIYNLGFDINIRTNRFFRMLYIRTHNRMGPYAAGLVVGYFMSIYKTKDYKKVWSKTVSFLGAYAALNLMFGVCVLGLLCFLYEVHGLLACVCAIFDRIVFAVAILGLIIFCTYGDVPLINAFLSWRVFGPLSRLSYGVYVIHLMFLYQSTSVRSHQKHHLFETVMHSFGLAVFSLMMSMIVWLLVEAPLINFTSRYLNTKSSTNVRVDAPANGISQNGASKDKVK